MILLQEKLQDLQKQGSKTTRPEFITPREILEVSKENESEAEEDKYTSIQDQEENNTSQDEQYTSIAVSQSDGPGAASTAPVNGPIKDSINDMATQIDKMENEKD